MKVVARLVLLFILTCSTCYGQNVTFKDSAGRYSGSASTRGNTTTFRDNKGRLSGTVTDSKMGSTIRDSAGRYSGSTKYGGGKTTFYDSKGRYTGQASGKVVVPPNFSKK